MSIRDPAWYQLRHSLVEDFLDLFLPPAYPFSVEKEYPRSDGMKSLVENRSATLDLPESNLLRLANLAEESCLEDPQDKLADWAVLFEYEILRGFGHSFASGLQGTEFEGLRKLAGLWGSYFAREVERFFHKWQLFSALTDFIFDMWTCLFSQIPAREMGEAIRESATPAYLRAGKTIHYQLALFHGDQAQMRESMAILQASDAELEREIADAFASYSTMQIGRQMQQMVIDAASQLRELFASSKFKNEFDSTVPTMLLATFRDMSWYIGYRLSQNLQCDPQRTTRLLEAINQHSEIGAAMEQYRYRHGWDGDIDKAVVLAWRPVARKYFHFRGELEGIRKDGDQARLVGVAQGLNDYTDRNRAIDAVRDGFFGRLGAYLKTSAENEKNDYLRKQITDGNRALTEAKLACDLRSIDEEEDEVSDEEILSQEKEKYCPSRDPVAEPLEGKENYDAWRTSLTEQERSVVDLRLTLGNSITEQEIAERMGISQPRVSQLLDQAWKKWRKID
jgi:RNA polymerase sigma factor (sigma-70 family)